MLFSCEYFSDSQRPASARSCLLPRLGREALPSPAGTSQAQHVFWGRNASYHGLAALVVSRDDTVLVPAYHCAAAIEPIVQYSAKVTF